MKLCPICAVPYPAGHRTCPTHGAVLVDTPELVAGAMIRDCYRIERVLGKGGMGIVYLAEHTLMGERRALKFLAGTLASNPSFVQRFLQEARAATKLYHPNIAQTFELGQAEDGSFYISMEFVDGPSLRALLEQSPHGLPSDRAFNIIRGVAGALAAAHAKRMVHRDIKPENILLAWTAESETAKVVDFGLVAIADGISKSNKTGTPLLTAEYAAPEQWRGLLPASDLDGRTDLYSLGCVFYEMLTGRLPFHSDTYEGWFEQHVNTIPIAPSQVRSELARFHGLDELVLKLLAKERYGRPGTVAEFLTALDMAIIPRPVAMEGKAAATSVTPAFDPAQRKRTILEVAEPAQPIVQQLPQPSESPVPPPPPPVFRPQQGASLPPTYFGQFPPARQPKPMGRRILMGTIGGIVALAILIIVFVAIVHYANEKNGDTSSQNNGGTNASSDGTAQTSSRHSRSTPGAASPGTESSPNNAGSQTGTANNGSAVSKQAVALFSQKQYAQSAPLFQQACDQGNADSCDYLGWMYQHQLGVEQNSTKAVALYNKGCLGGNMAACNNLGYMYQTPLGVKQDYARAQLLFAESCDSGLAIGCDNLGKMFERKLGVDQDYPRAAVLYEKACNGGSMDGCKSLGHLYENKLGVEQDYARAITLYGKACDGGIPEACRNLGLMYENKEGVPQDLPRAVALYQKACDQGNMDGCNDVGYMYHHHLGVEQNYARALAAYTKACDAGNATACNNLGVMYQDRQGVNQDYNRAANLYNKACNGGDASGCADLGDLYRDGNGVKRDPATARVLLSKACTLGNQTGCQHLKQLPQ